MPEEAARQVHAPLNKEPGDVAGDSAKVITSSLLKHVGGIVESCGATALFVYVDAIDEEVLDLDFAQAGSPSRIHPRSLAPIYRLPFLL
jgi:hypothetical protein